MTVKTDMPGGRGASALGAWLTAEVAETAMQARLQRAYLSWLQFIENPLAVIGLIIIVSLIMVAIFASVIAPLSPTHQDLDARLLPPGAGHWFGTDELGVTCSRALSTARASRFTSFSWSP